MPLPAALAGFKLTKDMVWSGLKWLAIGFVVWYALHTVNNYIADQKELRTEIVDQTVGRELAEASNKQLAQTQKDMQELARIQAEAVAQANAERAALDTEFTTYRKAQQALMRDLHAPDFVERATTKPREAEAAANALMGNLNTQMESVFDGS